MRVRDMMGGWGAFAVCPQVRCFDFSRLDWIRVTLELVPSVSHEPLLGGDGMLFLRLALRHPTVCDGEIWMAPSSPCSPNAA